MGEVCNAFTILLSHEELPIINCIAFIFRVQFDVLAIAIELPFGSLPNVAIMRILGIWILIVEYS